MEIEKLFKTLVIFYSILFFLALFSSDLTLEVFLYRGGLQRRVVGYGVDVRDGFPRTPLNKRTLLPHVRSFLKLEGDQ